MQVVVEAFKLQKAGNAPEEYEDAYWPRDALTEDVESFRLAVADGATETSFSGQWASILVDGFATGGLGVGALTDELTPLQDRWLREMQGKRLPWYAEEKLKSGAFATIAGLMIAGNEHGGGAWSAFAVGDSCIFQISGGRGVIQSFPLERPEDFDNSPLLISSCQTSNAKIANAVRQTSGDWNTGDIFYLMTDALACYFLRLWLEKPDDRDDLLNTFNNLDSAEFERLVDHGRQHISADIPPLLRNDDVTFVRCRTGER